MTKMKMRIMHSNFDVGIDITFLHPFPIFSNKCAIRVFRGTKAKDGKEVFGTKTINAR